MNQNTIYLVSFFKRLKKKRLVLRRIGIFSIKIWRRRFYVVNMITALKFKSMPFFCISGSREVLKFTDTGLISSLLDCPVLQCQAKLNTGITGK